MQKREIKKSLVLHNARFTENIATEILINILSRSDRGRFRKPDNLSIVFIHNREYKTIIEKSLDFLGIDGYTVLRPHLPKGHWRNSYKVPAALDFARHCEKEFILYIDSDDAVFMGDPQRAIDCLEEAGGDMLVSTTNHAGYDQMPEMENFFNQLAREAGWAQSPNIHLNSGVYISRRAHLIEFLREAAEYVTDDEPKWPEYKLLHQRTSSINPTFPLGCGSDQNIFRFLYPRFARSMRLDYAGRLAFR
jgi:hypothetical protein